MPWMCASCRVEVNDADACAGCGRRKTSWTVVADQTRTFVVKKASVALYRGDGLTSGPPGDACQQGVRLAPASWATALPVEVVEAIQARGHLPASASLLFVALSGAKPGEPVSVEVLFAGKPSRQLEVSAEVVDGAGVAFARLLCVAGPCGAAFEGVQAVDVGERTARGCAPSLEISALGRPPQEVPVRLARRFRFSA